MPSHDPATEELYQIAGDRPDNLPPELAAGSGAIAARPTAHAYVRYRTASHVDPLVLEVDIYQVPGAPTRVLLLCPRCRNSLTITSDRKEMRVQLPARGAEAAGAVISVAPFQCTWELTQQKALGGELCRWKGAIDNNVARDA